MSKFLIIIIINKFFLKCLLFPSNDISNTVSKLLTAERSSYGYHFIDQVRNRTNCPVKKRIKEKKKPFFDAKTLVTKKLVIFAYDFNYLVRIS